MSKPTSINLTPVMLIVTVVLLAMRAGGVIDWSLWACTAPVWAPFAFVYGLAFLLIVFAGLMALVAVVLGK